MIQLQDLRIGNYIYNESGIICTITKIDSENNLINEGKEIYKGSVSLLFDKNIGSIGSWIETCSSIPLTEEILLKLGFKKSGEYAKYIAVEVIIINEFILENISVSNDLSGKLSFLWLNDNLIVEDLKFVHQLQNLYYSLTGKELTFKE